MLKIGSKYTARHFLANNEGEKFNVGETLTLIDNKPKRYKFITNDGRIIIMDSCLDIEDYLVEYDFPLAKEIRQLTNLK